MTTTPIPTTLFRGADLTPILQLLTPLLPEGCTARTTPSGARLKVQGKSGTTVTFYPTRMITTEAFCRHVETFTGLPIVAAVRAAATPAPP